MLRVAAGERSDWIDLPVYKYTAANASMCTCCWCGVDCTIRHLISLMGVSIRGVYTLSIHTLGVVVSMESLKFGFDQSPTWKANPRTVWTLNANKLFAALLVEYTSSSPWDLNMLLAEASELSPYVQETQCTKAQVQRKYEDARNRTFKTGRANLHDVLQQYYSKDQLKGLECFLQEIREKQKLGRTFEGPGGEYVSDITL